MARRNLSPLPNVRVVVAPFETWDAGGQTVDLAYAASSWHWLDPEIRYPRAAALLKPGGSLAIISGGHAFPQDADPFFFEIQDVYRELDMQPKGEQWPPPLPEDVPDLREEIEATGLFAEFQSRRYVWEKLYTAETYIALLNSFSGHIALEPAKRDYLYRKVRERITARPDRRVRRHWLAILNLAGSAKTRPINRQRRYPTVILSGDQLRAENIATPRRDLGWGRRLRREFPAESPPRRIRTQDLHERRGHTSVALAMALRPHQRRCTEVAGDYRQ